EFSWRTDTYTPNGAQATARGQPLGAIEPIYDPLPDELGSQVLGPDGSRTDAHFSIWPGDMLDDSIHGFKGMYYGFPYGQYDPVQNRYLSTEQFHCVGQQCTKLRSTYVRHDLEPRQRPDPYFPEAPAPF